MTRNNVMLSRCTKGMVIVTNSAFICNFNNTLLGKLYTHMDGRTHQNIWVDWRDITARTANLPGVVAPKSLSAARQNPGVRSARASQAATSSATPSPVQGLADRLGKLSVTNQKPRPRLVMDPFPTLGTPAQRAGRANPQLKGQWKNGSDAVKSLW